MNPLVSIIVPCYNVELYLKDCVESILAQTYSNWELILVNDGSSDKTPQLCDQYVANDQRIKVLHKANGGLVSARNAGYETTTGEWIMYLDGDDWIETNTCEEIVKQIERHSPEIIFWKTLQNLNGKTITGKAEWKCSESKRVYFGSECQDLAYNTLIYNSGISTAFSKLLKRDFIEKYQLWHNPKLRQGAEGIEFSLRVFNSAQKALFINQYFTNYRYNENSISKRIDEKNTIYIVDCFNEIESYIQKEGKEEYFLPVFYQRILYVIIAIAMSTYFHPKNKESLFVRLKKFNKVIYDTPIFKDAIKNGDVSILDKYRKMTIYLIKLRCYFILPIISRTKQYLIKRGVFNY